MNSGDGAEFANAGGEVGVDPGERYGDYEVIKPIASGGMADIFLARKLGVQGFQKLVVVKRIRRELVKDDELIKMFIDEAHVAAKLDHPNVVVISDLGEVEDSYFMAMEYLRGQTLRALQKKITDAGKMLPPQFWARIMEYALDGLHYAHELRGDDGNLMGLVHRDFTPSNIMITYSGTVKVIDFGVAHVEAPTRHETKVGTIKGKIAYMSPEQVRGTQVVDRRTDVFAAGIMLWELLSRKQLFNGPSDTATIVEILQGEIAPPGWEGQPVDWELQNIVMRALQRDLGQRYQSAAEMRDALREYLRRRPEKVDATDISTVMNQLFDKEKIEDDRFMARDPSKSTPIPGRRDSSRSGPVSRSGSRSGASKSGSRSGGSARGQMAAPSVVQQPSKSKIVPLILGMTVLGLGVGGGVWYFTRPPPPPVVEQPQPPQQQFAHPAQIPTKPQEPPVQDPPVKPSEPPTVAVVPNDKPPEHHDHTTKNTSPNDKPSGGFGTLDFDTRPYTSVFIGKKKLGDTPLLGVKVPAGTFTLTLVNDDAGVHESYVITVPKDGHVFKKLKL